MECTHARTPALERAYAEVAGRAFKRPSDFRDHKLAWLKRPRYDRQQTRVVVDEGKVVAGVAIVELPVHYGDAVLTLGGISCVATDPDAWKRGYGRACMEDTIDYMTRAGYDASFLLGIRNYYPKFGYRTALAWFACRYNPSDTPATMSEGWRWRPARKSDIPAMDALYRRSIAPADLSVARTEADWRWYWKFGKMAHAYVVLAPDRSIAAYAIVNPRGNSLRVEEVAAVESDAAHEAILALIRDRAKEAFASSAEVFAVPEGPFARYCFYRKRIEWRRWTDYDGGPMLRLMNVEPLFGKVAATLAARWADAPRSAPAAPMTIACPMGRAALVPADGGLRVCPGETAGEVVAIPDEALTELFFGFRPTADVLADEGVKASDAARRVIEAVFPVGRPYISPLDHM